MAESEQKMTIGEKIQALRIHKNLTQKAIADSLNISVTAYGNIERGEADVTFSRLEAIALILGITLKDIINLTDTVNNNNTSYDSGVSFFLNGGVVNHNERSLFDQVLTDKNNEIAYLRAQLDKYTGRGN